MSPDNQQKLMQIWKDMAIFVFGFLIFILYGLNDLPGASLIYSQSSDGSLTWLEWWYVIYPVLVSFTGLTLFFLKIPQFQKNVGRQLKTITLSQKEKEVLREKTEERHKYRGLGHAYQYVLLLLILGASWFFFKDYYIYLLNFTKWD